MQKESNVERSTSHKTSKVSARSYQGNPVVELLRFEFSSRSEKNPQFSLRSFAKFLGVSHALLSLVLNEKRSPSKAFIGKMSERLALNPESRSILQNSLKNEIPKTTEEVRYQKIGLDQFALVSEWQHFAILSLLEIEDTILRPEFISKRLGISETLARVSLKRLFDLDLLVKDEKSNRWQQKPGPIVVENSESTAYTRRFQNQLMNKALESLEADPIMVRDHSSTTFSMNPKNIPYALKRIRSFRRELTKELEDMGEKEEVYNLTVQIFPTSRRSIR